MSFNDRLQKIKKLSSQERFFLFKSLFLLVIVRFGLYFLGLRRVQIALGRFADVTKNTTADTDITAWVTKAKTILRIASHNGVFHPSCLVQSLCFWFLLKQRGLPGELYIGVNQEQGQYNAHAWIEDAGVVLYDSLETHNQFAKFHQTMDYAFIK